MTSTLATYLQITTNMDRYEKITEAEPMVKSQTEYYQANIGNAKTPSDLVNNYRLFSYVMTAYGLGDMISYGKGEIQKVLEQGTGSTSDLAYTLNNPQIMSLAQTFNFAANGTSTTSSNAVQNGVVSNYVEQQLESDQGQSNPGVQLALYFQANAPKITSAYNILADKNLLNVVETTLGISQYISYEDVDTQAKLITTDLNNAGMSIADFQDSTKVQKFVEKFAAMYDATNSNPSSDSLVPNAMLSSSSSTTAFSSSLLTSMQGLKLGGY
jgi:Protein of unknown function (DUF1217)